MTMVTASGFVLRYARGQGGVGRRRRRHVVLTGSRGRSGTTTVPMPRDGVKLHVEDAGAPVRMSSLPSAASAAEPRAKASQAGPVGASA